jgi:DsbC/DsbD-like thiol-disulfide interchange protein
MKHATQFLAMAGLIVALTMLSGTATAQKRAKNSEAVVKVTAKADKPDADGKQVVTITLNVDKDWHTYANPVGLEDLEGAQTVVQITAKKKPESVKIDYPKGKVHEDKVVGNYSIYEGKVEIKATVQRAKGDSSPLEVKVKFNACSDVTKTCLPEATVKLTVE